MAVFPLSPFLGQNITVLGSSFTYDGYGWVSNDLEGYWIPELISGDRSIHPRWNNSNNSNIYGLDAFGFNLLPSGYRSASSGTYNALGKTAILWTSTEYSSGNGAYTWSCFYNQSGFYSTGDEPNVGNSVKIVRDITSNDGDNIDGRIIKNVFTDPDGNTYDGVIMNSKIWSTTYLRTTTYADGSVINDYLDDNQWVVTTEGAQVVFNLDYVSGIDDEETLAKIYGRLYNLYAVTNASPLIDPAQGYIPTDDDYRNLRDYLDNTYNEISSSNLGNHFKSIYQVNSPYLASSKTLIKPLNDKLVPAKYIEGISGVISSYTESSTPPENPKSGDEWLFTDTGTLYKWFEDSDRKGAWVVWQGESGSFTVSWEELVDKPDLSTKMDKNPYNVNASSLTNDSVFQFWKSNIHKITWENIKLTLKAYFDTIYTILNPNQKDAIDGATSPSSTNVFATMNDVSAAGGGDMLKSMYDPTTKESDAFSMDNMVETTTKKILTNIERTNWNEAHSWGDHGAAGYLTSYTETDPVFSGSEASNITSQDILNLSNLSGTNSGDETKSSIETKLQAASSSIDGYLLSVDWNTFNNKSDFSGSYTDLTNKPTIPTNNNELTNGAGYITDYSETDPIYTGDRVVQTLSGTSPTWNANNGHNAKITLSGNTTITMSNLPLGATGNLTVTGTTSYTLNFSGYTFKKSPALESGGGAITMTGNDVVDVISWYYDGTQVIINGTLGYE